jgi:hypothetical protein
MPALPIYTAHAIRKLEELAGPASGTLGTRRCGCGRIRPRSLRRYVKAILVVGPQ